MCLETAQLLSTVVQELVGDRVEGLYKPTHVNHPCTRWLAQHRDHFDWVVEHGKSIGLEYTTAYGKVHKSVAVIFAAEKYADALDFPLNEPILPPACMPDEYKTDCVVESYRNYYLGDKAHFAKWDGRKVPYWWPL